MSELVPMASSELTAASTADLRAELARGLTLTAQTLIRLGMVWAELERRGEDLSSLRYGLARVLPLIASGLLAAETVVAFAGRPAILRALEGLPLEQQRALADGGTVEVATATNSQRTELVPVANIPGARLRIIFQDGQILSPAEQRVRLGRKKKQQVKDESDEEYRRYRPRYDKASGLVHVGPRLTIRLDDLLHELASVSGPDHPPEEENEYLVVKTRLKHSEVKRFLATCSKTELPDWELIRKAMRAFGLI